MTAWQDYPSRATPITAAELNRIEGAIASLHERIQANGPGTEGRGVVSIEVDPQNNGQAIITYSDGTTNTIALPAGPQGAPGTPPSASTAVDKAPTTLGQIAVVAGIPFVAVGTTSAADWKQIATI